ncbi:MAG: dienelactone hydrolase family protein [Ardenticatenaceae bacterium]|nr:dienelactone hydrolase family protein [Ardenticatenaceae bacterium]MCB8988943.1 dienelactone hydrolase family protein [Ardenticatenaceae bacterium]
MRPLEVVILAGHLLTIGWLYAHIQGSPAAEQAAVLIVPLVIVLHVLWEKPRWQMAPAYGQAGVVLAVAWAGKWTAFGVNGWAIFCGIVLYLASVVLPYVLAVPHLPRPAGPYAVGTRTFYLVDKTRSDAFGPDQTEPRELMVQVWYPAEKKPNARRAPFIADFKIGGPAIARRFGFPPFVVRHVDLVRTHSFLAAPAAEAGGPFPVLTFSHGYLGLHSQNTWQMEELASQGYVVVAPNHTRGAIVTVFPDGRVVFGLTTLPDDMSPEQAGRLGMQQWAADVQFVLDQLACWQAEVGHSFYGRLDLSRIGCFGHSMGGGAAVHLAAGEARCRALLLLDPWLRPVDEAILQQGLDVPVLSLMSEGEFGRINGQLAEQLTANGRADGLVATIAGTGHYDYSDLPLLSPATRLFGAKGPINGRRAARIINDYTLAFFDTYLRERPSPLLKEAKPYPEVQIHPV